ncbi:MAG: hypothetical protein US61_C0043G0006 [Parcubacteria group bacterium GW2011_GWE2_37_8]|nr:MAG: hypothetical protein US61_C0043G0006 [Parcubacteria group bacterium GW2011_GWE2_37_8]
MFGNEFQDSFCRISVRIKETNSIAVLDILDNHIRYHFRFTHTAFSDGVKMTPPIIDLYAESLFFVSKSCFSEIVYLFVHVGYKVIRL